MQHGYHLSTKIKEIENAGDFPFYNWPKWGYTLSAKISSKMPHVWNYLRICPYFKLDYLKIEFQWKTRFGENWDIGNQT